MKRTVWELRIRTYVFLLLLVLLWAISNLWHSCSYLQRTARRPSFARWWWDASVLAPPYDMAQLSASDMSTLVDYSDFSFTLNSRRCDADKDLFLVIFVHSAPAHFSHRKALRETWGHESNLARDGMRLVFLLGETRSQEVQVALEEEHRKYEDLVQGNFVDSYRNLTYKHVMGLKWITYHCRQARYIFKADDDIFVDIRQMAQYIKGAWGLAAQRRLLFCFVYHAPPVKRSHRSKWYVSFREYSADYYPSYCAGWGILMSPDVVFALYTQSPHEPYFWVDDVHVSGTLAHRAGISHSEFNHLIDHSDELVQRWLADPGLSPPVLFGYPDAKPELIYRMWNKTQLFYQELDAATKVQQQIRTGR